MLGRCFSTTGRGNPQGFDVINTKNMEESMFKLICQNIDVFSIDEQQLH